MAVRGASADPLPRRRTLRPLSGGLTIKKAGSEPGPRCLRVCGEALVRVTDPQLSSEWNRPRVHGAKRAWGDRFNLRQVIGREVVQEVLHLDREQKVLARQLVEVITDRQIDGEQVGDAELGPLGDVVRGLGIWVGSEWRP